MDIGAGDAAVELMKGLVSGIGGFGGQFPLDTARFAHPVLVASTDGVGTKLVVARASGRYDTVGIDLVAMCVDDLVCVGAEPLFMLDYIATGKVDPARIEAVVAGVGEGCRLAGCSLIGGETAEHPGVMAPDDLDIAGFAVGAVEQGTQLGPERVRVGDVIIGLPSPGLRSNGYTLARLVLLAPEYGGRALSDPAWEGAEVTVGDELLRPSVIYTPAVLRVREALGDGLHACAHITGGGIVGNLPRVLPEDTAAQLERSSWVEPRIFGEIQRLGAVEESRDGPGLQSGGGDGAGGAGGRRRRRPGGPGRGGPPLHGHRSGDVP